MTTDTRQAFEEWANDQGFPTQYTRHDNEGYQDLRTQGAWDSWHAATLAERERCAKVCESLGMATNGVYERNQECADKIRSGE